MITPEQVKQNRANYEEETLRSYRNQLDCNLEEYYRTGRVGIWFYNDRKLFEIVLQEYTKAGWTFKIEEGFVGEDLLHFWPNETDGPAITNPEEYYGIGGKTEL